MSVVQRFDIDPDHTVGYCISSDCLFLNYYDINAIQLVNGRSRISDNGWWRLGGCEGVERSCECKERAESEWRFVLSRWDLSQAR